MKKFIKIALSIGRNISSRCCCDKNSKRRVKKNKEEEENKKDKKLEKLGLSNKEKNRRRI